MISVRAYAKRRRDGWHAYCLEYDLRAFGRTRVQALHRLQRRLKAFLDSAHCEPWPYIESLRAIPPTKYLDYLLCRLGSDFSDRVATTRLFYP